MSYSFTVRTADKASARTAIAAEFEKVVEQQPIHSADRDQAEANAQSALNLIPDPSAGEEISISVNGWVQWRGTLGAEQDVGITGVSISASASIIKQQ